MNRNTFNLCGNCGAGIGVDPWQANQCPSGGVEECRDGFKQVYQETTFKDAEVMKLEDNAPAMLKALQTVNKYFIDLQNRCALTPHEEKVWSQGSKAIN